MEHRMKFALAAMLVSGLFACPASAQESSSAPHNIIIFVADGLRYGSVDQTNMPNMARLKAQGVDFTNSHSLFPTVTTVNASAIATGHYVGDTGDFGNIIFTGQPMQSLKGGTLGFLENDRLLTEMNQKFGGNYLGETTLIAAARAHGWQTAIIGKEGPARIQDSTATPDQTLIVDDKTGSADGLALPAWFDAGMKNAGLVPPLPAASVPDIAQEDWMSKAATEIVLPHFKTTAKPFVLLFWSRDPDFSQHNGKDSIGSTMPGINGPSGKAGTRDADTRLGELLKALKAQGLDKTTDVFCHRRPRLYHHQPRQRRPRRPSVQLSVGRPGDPFEPAATFRSVGQRPGASASRGGGRRQFGPDLSARRGRAGAGGSHRFVSARSKLCQWNFRQ
jgi:predicted AlkP superfamily pyrophosphatase or phosphodiesterase